jgi:hypothetical protein
MSGSSESRRATRTCSRAALGASAQRQASHSAHEPTPDAAKPPRRSSSATSSSQRAAPRGANARSAWCRHLARRCDRQRDGLCRGVSRPISLTAPRHRRRIPFPSRR